MTMTAMMSTFNEKEKRVQHVIIIIIGFVLIPIFVRNPMHAMFDVFFLLSTQMGEFFLLVFFSALFWESS